jgi:hypothetical protein
VAAARNDRQHSTCGRTPKGKRLVDKTPQGHWAWFAIRHNRHYLGVVSLQYMLEYINTLRSQDMKTAGEIQKNMLGKSVIKDDRFRLFFWDIL